MPCCTFLVLLTQMWVLTEIHSNCAMLILLGRTTMDKGGWLWRIFNVWRHRSVPATWARTVISMATGRDLVRARTTPSMATATGCSTGLSAAWSRRPTEASPKGATSTHATTSFPSRTSHRTCADRAPLVSLYGTRRAARTRDLSYYRLLRLLTVNNDSQCTCACEDIAHLSCLALQCEWIIKPWICNYSHHILIQ